jgi:hypothetical protein
LNELRHLRAEQLAYDGQAEIDASGDTATGDAVAIDDYAPFVSVEQSFVVSPIWHKPSRLPAVLT